MHNKSTLLKILFSIFILINSAIVVGNVATRGLKDTAVFTILTFVYITFCFISTPQIYILSKEKEITSRDQNKKTLDHIYNFLISYTLITGSASVLILLIITFTFGK